MASFCCLGAIKGELSMRNRMSTYLQPTAASLDDRASLGPPSSGVRTRPSVQAAASGHKRASAKRCVRSPARRASTSRPPLQDYPHRELGAYPGAIERDIVAAHATHAPGDWEQHPTPFAHHLQG